MKLYHVTFMMREEVHVQVTGDDDLSPTEAARKGLEKAEQWANQTDPLEDVWTGPEETYFDEEALVSEAIDGGPPYWNESVEVFTFEAARVSSEDGN